MRLLFVGPECSRIRKGLIAPTTLFTVDNCGEEIALLCLAKSPPAFRARFRQRRTFLTHQITRRDAPLHMAGECGRLAATLALEQAVAVHLFLMARQAIVYLEPASAELAQKSLFRDNRLHLQVDDVLFLATHFLFLDLRE